MLKICVQCGNMHFLPSAEVFSTFSIVTPIGKSPNKKAVQVSCLRLRPKDFLIFRIVYSTLLCFVKQSLTKGLPPKASGSKIPVRGNDPPGWVRELTNAVARIWLRLGGDFEISDPSTGSGQAALGITRDSALGMTGDDALCVRQSKGFGTSATGAGAKRGRFKAIPKPPSEPGLRLRA